MLNLILAIALLCATGIVRAADTVEQADAIVDRYLDRIGLDELLVRRLADRIAVMKPGEDRADAVRLLANAYARLLEHATTDEQRRRWEAAASELIRNAPDEATTELRLSLARVSYRQLEETATRWMMAMADESDRQLTLRRFVDLLDEIDRLADRAQGEYQLLEQRETNERRPGAMQGWAERKAEAGRLRSMAHYLAGWAALHAADLEPSQERQTGRAQRALGHLGWLLNAPRDRAPELDRLPEGTLVFEHVARAAIAAAAAFARAGNTAEANEWFDALEAAPDLNAGARDILRQRRAIALAQAGRWEELAARTFASDIDTDVHVSVADARLLAALALAAPTSQPWTPRDERWHEFVRDRALAALVAANELGHVLDLSKRFGLDQLGGNTFVAHQVKALRLYQQARDAHEQQGSADAPTTDASIAETYRLAGIQFSAALNASDAATYSDALGSCVMLLGLSQYYAGLAPSNSPEAPRDLGLLAAVDAFERASRELRSADRAAAALWMAIHTLDQLLDEGLATDPSSIEARRDRLEARFLLAFPEHAQAAAITIRRADSNTVLSLEQRIEMLRKIDSTSPMRASAERQAARLAYDAWRSATTSSERDWMAARYLAMAEPLLADDRRAARQSADAAQRAVLRARRMAEVALAMGEPDTAHAQTALDVADALIAEGLADPSVADELKYRQAQLALALGEIDHARRLVEALQTADPQYAIAAQRLFLQHALRAWLRVRPAEGVVPPPALSAEQQTAAQHIVSAGTDLLQSLEEGGTQDVTDSAEVLHVCKSLAEALFALRFGTDDEQSGVLAATYNQRILDVLPRDAAALRRAAELDEAAGRFEAALESWRMLLTGLPPGQPSWYEAKYRVVRLLAAHDPARARQVIDQHRVLHPSYGPAPWGEQLRQLDQSIPPASNGDES